EDETFTLKTNDNGTITQTYTPKKVGTQTITATYSGDSQYINSTSTTSITVKKINTKIDLKVSNTTPINNTPITITVTLTDADGNKLVNQQVTLNINGKTVTAKTNNNGIITQNYTPTKVETQNITATYNGTSQYINSTATTSITVKKINTKLSVKVSNTTPVNNTNITITATLTDTDNKAIANQNITIKVSDKTFNIKTNNNGIATQTYTPTKVEKQTITATYKGDSQHNNSTATTNITVKKINTKIDLKVSNNTPINNTPITITITLTDANNNKLANQQVTLNINGKTVTAKTNTNGIITQNYTPTKVETQNITATYTGDSRYNNSTKTIKITVKNKIKTKTTVNPATGVIGEKLTIKATVTDTNGGKVNEGNLIFKVNGVTIKDNGKLTGSNNPLKIKLVNGVATATIIPDINMTNSKNITAYYVGTTIYNASTSSPASINISKRNATIEVTTNKKIIKQGQVLTITAKIYDTTNGKKTSNITRYQDEYVYFKVNGITLKDANGEMLKVKIVNGTATVNYTIPLGISCVTDMQTLTPKNHTIQVGLYNKNYQNIMTKTPTFQVERSNITINLANATINNKTHTLSMKITIKDYLGNTVAGPNKCIIKVNGVTLKNGTNVQYYYTTDGVLNLKNIPVPQSKNYTSIEVITQDRLAYNSQRNTTKVIKITN
ncbi:MAG: Ig-like domain repeat protein, partial [Methanosphaera sp.]|nr:Ig-like domain repeat protein [Methanosphaera sp.]